MEDYALVNAVRSIAHGDVNGPGGLEALSMSIGDIRTGESLCKSLDGIAAALDRLAAAVEAIAEK